MRLYVLLALTLSAGACASARASAVHPEAPPLAPRSAATTTGFGASLADPYRSLEDATCPNTQRWVQAQTQRSEVFLAALPGRDKWLHTLDRMEAYPKIGTPMEVGGRTYWTYNDATLAHHVLCTGDVADRASWSTLLDPAKLDPSGRTALSGLAPGPRGHHLAYAVSVAGSDVQHWRICRLAAPATTCETLEPVKFPELAWRPDESGFYYSRMDPAKGPGGADRPDSQQQVFFHRLGTPQAQDLFIFAHPQPAYDATASLAADGSVLVVSTARGSERRQGFYVGRPQPDGVCRLRQVLAENTA